MTSRLSVLALLLGFNAPAHAGNGWHYGLDGIVHFTETSTETLLEYDPPVVDSVFSKASQSESVSDVGVRVGYKYKRRRNRSFFLVPEVFLSTLDMEKAVYGTTLKMGLEKSSIAVFGGLGISHIEQFNTNELNLTAGLDYKITDQWSVNLEWVYFDTIDERSSETQSFGLQTLTATTDTERRINALKLGITFYLHE